VVFSEGDSPPLLHS
jgi:hypothetical protein